MISGGKDSHIFEYLKSNNISDASIRIDDFRNSFGDDFVLDVQLLNRIDEIDYLNVLPIAKDKGIPLIATNDVLFAEKDDYEIHETKVCINTENLNDPNREDFLNISTLNHHRR